MKKGLALLMELVFAFSGTALADLNAEITEKAELFNQSARELGMPKVEPGDYTVIDDGKYTRYSYTLSNGLELAFLTADGNTFFASMVRFGQEDALADFFGTCIVAAFAMQGQDVNASDVHIGIMQEFFMARNNTDYADSTVGPFTLSISRHTKGYLFLFYRND